MGCLPVLLLFPLGAGVGYLVGGDVGALWGAGLGVVLGLLLMGLLIRAMRHRPPLSAKSPAGSARPTA